MKITTLQPQVKLNTSGNAQIGASRDINAYGGNQYGSNNLGKAFSQVGNFIDREMEEKMTADVMAANSEYSKRLNDTLYGENGLMLKQQDGAANLTQEFEDAEKKIRQEVLREKKISYQKATTAFNATADREYQQRYELARRHQFVEQEKYKDTTLGNKLYETADFAGKNFADENIYKSSLETGNAFIAARYANAGAETIKAKQNEFRQVMVTKVFNSAYEAEDYDTLEVLATKFKNDLPSELVSKAGKIVGAQRKENEEIKLVQDLHQKYSGNIEAMLAEIDNMGNYKSDGTGVENIVNAMKSQIGIPYELGGDGISSTDCGQSIKLALNKAGIQWNTRYVPYMMAEAEEKNIWKDKNSGYKPKAGDLAVVNGDEHIVMIDENGGVIQAGTSVMQVYQSSKSVDDMFNGSITGYIATSELAGGTGGNSRGKAMSLKDKERLKERAMAYASKQERIENFKKQEILKGAENAMYELYRSGVVDEKEYISTAKQYAGGDVRVFESLVRSGKFFSGLNAKPVTPKMSDTVKIKLHDAIETGQIKDRESLSQYLQEQNVSYAEYKEFTGALEKQQKGEDKYSYSWQGMKQSAFTKWGNKDETIWYYAKQAGDEFIEDFKSKNNGRLPPEASVAEKIIAAGIKPSVGFFSNTSGYTYWEKQGLSQAAMGALGLYDMEEVVVNGKPKVRFYYNGGNPPLDYSPEDAAAIIRPYK